MDINRFVYRCVYEFVRVCVCGGGGGGGQWHCASLEYIAQLNRYIKQLATPLLWR